MTNSKELTPDLVRQIIDAEEIPLRSRSFEPQTVKNVLRYGAMAGSVIEYHEHLPRGMDRAHQLINESEAANRSFPSGTVILAEAMDNSKGRFQRSWDAPRGGLWMTLILVNTLLPESSRLYPLAAGTACCELLQGYNIPARIKWVNDILVDGKKIAGILTETAVGPHSGEEFILIGIGLNVNNDIFPDEIADTAVSMQHSLNEKTDLTMLAARMLAKLCWNIGLLHFDEARYLAEDDRVETVPAESTHATNLNNLLLTSYTKLTDIYNRRVIFGFDVQKQPQYEARVLGLHETGGLILQMDDGSTLVEHSGEIIYLD
ncbi:MAG: biotin--[acetyl-CoA-carboxylase] ligase [Proteobacteria bacterium]|nr:biotin--[acetyl-CoA-carboxylase] ligase [Pseudomonadota bacterium]